MKKFVALFVLVLLVMGTVPTSVFAKGGPPHQPAGWFHKYKGNGDCMENFFIHYPQPGQGWESGRCPEPEPEVCEWDSEIPADDPNCVEPEEEVCEWDSEIPADDPACVEPDDGDNGNDDDGGDESTGPVWVPTGVETQSMRVTNPEWLVLAQNGELYYSVYWVNAYGQETLIEECQQPVSYYGDISCVLAPDTVPDGEIFLLYTYISGPDLGGMVMVNWVDDTDTVHYASYDTTNLGERIMGGFEYAPVPAEFFAE